MKTEERYHLIGLGGIGMSALARILLQEGCSVQGSDQSASLLLEDLHREGAEVNIGHNAELLKQGTTVVYSSGIRAGNEELARARELALPILHRSDLLDFLMKGKKPLLVTGTHGKTTTTSLLVSVCSDAHLDPSFAIGGILISLNTNGKRGDGPFFVAEADESDHSFLKTSAFGAIVTNLDNDHLDYWKSEADLEAAFQQFFSQVKEPQHLFWCCDDPRLKTLAPAGFSYGFSKEADVRVESFEQRERGIVFDLHFQGKTYRKISLSLFGRHNALNGSAVFAMALSLKIPEQSIRETFSRFAGAKRRLEFKGEVHRVRCFDDYGHHPAEIIATLKAVRDHVRERRLIAIFQPHRYTRVRDLFHCFLTCFDDADEVVLTDIYSAGESPIDGVTSASLYTRMKEKLGTKLRFFPRSHLESGVVEMLRPLDVIVTIGAGDVTQAGEPILKRWGEQALKVKVALLCGGTSAEHEVAVNSAINIAKGLDPTVYDVCFFGVTKKGQWLSDRQVETFSTHPSFDAREPRLNGKTLEKLMECEVAIPVFHGPQGEDGMMQGFFDTLQIPYAGCDYRSGALCMHKGWTKQIALMNHIPTPPFLEIGISEYRADPEKWLARMMERFSFPVWIKPVHLGSSIGVSRADNVEEAKIAAERAFYYDDYVIIEEHVEGKQIEFGMIGNEYIRVGPPCEILNGGEFVDYAGKYGPSAMGYAIPARITDLQASIGVDLAKRTYLAAGCKGLARIDFFLDQSGHYWLNEINPFPGCTNTSAFPQIWAAAGVGMDQICDELIALAWHRTRALQRIRGR